MDAARFFTLAAFFRQCYDLLSAPPENKRGLLEGSITRPVRDAIYGRRGTEEDTLNFPRNPNPRLGTYREVQRAGPGKSQIIEIQGTFMQCLDTILQNQNPSAYESANKSGAFQLQIFFREDTDKKKAFFQRLVEVLTELKTQKVDTLNSIVKTIAEFIGAPPDTGVQAAINRLEASSGGSASQGGGGGGASRGGGGRSVSPGSLALQAKVLEQAKKVTDLAAATAAAAEAEEARAAAVRQRAEEEAALAKERAAEAAAELERQRLVAAEAAAERQRAAEEEQARVVAARARAAAEAAEAARQRAAEEEQARQLVASQKAAAEALAKEEEQRFRAQEEAAAQQRRALALAAASAAAAAAEERKKAREREAAEAAKREREQAAARFAEAAAAASERAARMAAAKAQEEAARNLREEQDRQEAARQRAVAQAAEAAAAAAARELAAREKALAAAAAAELERAAKARQAVLNAEAAARAEAAAVARVEAAEAAAAAAIVQREQLAVQAAAAIRRDAAASQLRQERLDVVTGQAVSYAAQLGDNVANLVLRLRDTPENIVAIFQNPTPVLRTIANLLRYAQENPDYISGETTRILYILYIILSQSLQVASGLYTTLLDRFSTSLESGITDAIKACIVGIFVVMVFTLLTVVRRNEPVAPQYAATVEAAEVAAPQDFTFAVAVQRTEGKLFGRISTILQQFRTRLSALGGTYRISLASLQRDVQVGVAAAAAAPRLEVWGTPNPNLFLLTDGAVTDLREDGVSVPGSEELNQSAELLATQLVTTASSAAAAAAAAAPASNFYLDGNAGFNAEVESSFARADEAIARAAARVGSPSSVAEAASAAVSGSFAAAASAIAAVASPVTALLSPIGLTSPRSVQATPAQAAPVSPPSSLLGRLLTLSPSPDKLLDRVLSAPASATVSPTASPVSPRRPTRSPSPPPVPTVESLYSSGASLQSIRERLDATPLPPELHRSPPQPLPPILTAAATSASAAASAAASATSAAASAASAAASAALGLQTPPREAAPPPPRLSPISQLPQAAAAQDQASTAIDPSLVDEANAFLRTLTPRELAFFEGIRKFYGHGRQESATRSRQDVEEYEILLRRYFDEEQNLSDKIDKWRLRKGYSKTLFFQARPSSKAYILSSILYPNPQRPKPWNWSRAEFARINL